MNNIKIGIVKGLLYYDYKDLLCKYLQELNIKYITSNNTNKKTIEDGKKLLVDESCLSLKIYFGHLKELIDKCDYILVIRSSSLKKDELMCTNFYSIYDLANNIFKDKIIEINIDQDNDISIKDAFINFGCNLGIKKNILKKAYNKAYIYYLKEREKMYLKQIDILKSKNKKILLAGHSYNLMDEYIIKDIKDILKDNQIDYIYSNYFNKNNNDYKYISKDVYWSNSIDILRAIEEYQDYIDGIILISTFPCGCDSLVNEMILRKVKLPILNLVIDELNDNGYIATRVESFIDIIKMEEDKYEYES